MVYKRYIKKGEKSYGPYEYRSVKQDGKVISEYVGKGFKKEMKNKIVCSKNCFVAIMVLLLILILLQIFVVDLILTGRATMSSEKTYLPGEQITGSVKIRLDSGELIPASSKIVVDNSGDFSEYPLSDFLGESSFEGNFYVSGKEVSGYGFGYGVEGERVIYPEVNFVLRIVDVSQYNEEKDNGDEARLLGESNETEIVEENTNETVNVEESEVVEEQNTEVIEVESSPITGAVIDESSNLLEGSVSKENPFSYSISEGKDVEIVSSDQKINLEIKEGILIVTTDYSEIEKGYGQEYSGNGEVEYEIILDSLNLTAKEGQFKLSIVYEEQKLVSVEKKIMIYTEGNQTLEEFEQTNASIDETVINFTDGSLKIDTTQYGAVVGMPVKWKKKISVDNLNNISIELPKEAENISVYAIENNSNNESVSEDISDSGFVSITGQATADLSLGEKSSIFKFFKKIFGSITGKAIDVQEDEESVIVNIDENASEYEIEYETPAPVSVEESLSNGKKIVVSSDVHYENILAYSELPYETPLNRIRLYYYDDITGVKSLANFDAYDYDGNLIKGNTPEERGYENVSVNDLFNISESVVSNNMVSFITWVVPHLSNQTYEIIIEISNAEHLYSNRSVIENIYNNVKSQDGVWSNINDSEYVRITFTENLTNINDITVYARNLSNETASIEIYSEDGSQIISTIDKINSEGWYKTYLTNLSQSTGVFDLKIIGNIEFDYIVDPYYLNISVNGTGTNVTVEPSSFAHLNVSDGSLVAYYPFDVSDGNATWVVGNNSGGLQLDGVNDYVRTPTSTFFATEDRTVSLWIKQSATSGTTQYAFAGGNSGANRIYIGANSGNLINIVGTRDTSVHLGQILTPNVWYHIVITYKNSTNNASTYVNGVYGSSNNTNLSSAAAFNLGSYNYASNFWNGSVDEVRTFNRVLNDTEILELYSHSVLNRTGLTLEWLMDENNGFIAYDASGNNNVGDIIGYTRNTYDYTTNSNDGVINGAVFNSSGGFYSSGSYEFDGVDDYINLTSSSTLQTLSMYSNHTISIWFKTNTSSNSYLFSSYAPSNYLVLVVNGGTGLRLAYYNGTFYAKSTTTAFNDNRWHNVVAIRENNITRLFVDNVEMSGSSVESVSNVQGVYLGVIQGRGFFNGSTDDLMVFNRALSDAEVAQIYSSSYSRFYPTGEMLFQNLNLGTNNTVNLSLTGCSQTNGSYIQGKINEGNYQNFSTCTLTDYSASGNLTSANLTVKFVASPNNFYSPLIIGNVTVNDYLNESSVTECKTLSTAGNTYTLRNNVTSTGTCITIGANNIVLDCGGNWITYSTGGVASTYGISITNFGNITIKNCKIVDGNWSSSGIARYGIYQFGGDNSTFFNNFVNTSNSYPIYLLSQSNFNNISNNVLYSNSSSGISWDASDYNNVSNNNITSNKLGNGVYITSTSANNFVVNNTISSSAYSLATFSSGIGGNTFINNTATTSSSVHAAIYLQVSSNNTFINNTAIAPSTFVIYIRGTSASAMSVNNTFINCTAIGGTNGVFFNYAANNTLTNLNSTGTTGARFTSSYSNLIKDCKYLLGGTNDVVITSDAGSINNTFLNCSYTLSKESVSGAANSLNRKWYIDANVSYSNVTAVSSANLTIYNSSSISVYSALTDSNGDIAKQEITEYINLGGTRTYSTPHQINVTKTGYTTNSTSYNLTSLNNIFGILTLYEAPDTTAPAVVITSPANNSYINSVARFDALVSDNSGTTYTFINDTSLVGYWTFDTTNSTGVYDTSGKNNFGSFIGNASVSNITYGKFGDGLTLDGSNAGLRVADSDFLDMRTNDFAVTGWIKLINRTPSEAVGRHGGGYNVAAPGWTIYFNGGNPYLQFSSTSAVYKNGMISSATQLSENQWYHFAGIFDRDGNYTWYLNGIRDGNSVDISASNGVDIVSNGFLFIGTVNGNLYLLNGSIDELTVFNRTLSSDEVKALYNSSAQKFNASYTLPSSGVNNLQLVAVDTSSNTNITSLTLNNDATSPTITFENQTPSNSSFVSSTTQTIFGNVSDSSNQNGSAFIDFDRSLVGYWSMDYYNSTGVYDNSSYNNFGNFNGGLNYSNLTTGARGNGLRFDAVDDYINVGLISGFTDKITISSWIYLTPPNGGGTTGVIFSNINGVLGNSLMVNDSGRVYSQIWINGSRNTVQNLNILNNYSGWHHIVYVYNGSAERIYVDSVAGTALSASGNINASTTSSNIGKYRDAIFLFNGSIDEVIVFNRSLSTTEISALYNSQSNKFNSTFSSLSAGQHNYTLYGVDTAGNVNTSIRNFFVDRESPQIEFVSPTEINGAEITKNYTYVNTTITDNVNSDRSAFIDFDRSLVGYWSMDYYNFTGVYDNSSYGNFGKFSGTGPNLTNISQGARGNGLQFDGVDDYVNTGVSQAFNLSRYDFTMSTWFYAYSSNPWAGIQMGITYQAGQVLAQNRFITYNGSSAQIIDYSPVPSLNEWYQVTATHNATSKNITVYINGAYSGSLVYIGNLISTNGILTIGARPSAGFFNGSIDEVLIFNRSLSTIEIQALYNNSAYRYENNFTNLVKGVTHNYSVYSMDAAGNLNSSTRSLTVDGTAPQVTVALPVEGNTYTTSSVTLQVTTNENSTCNYSLDSFLTNTSMTVNSNGTIHTADSTLSNANYVVNYSCVDLNSNVNSSNGATFSVNVPVVSGGSTGGGDTGGGGGGGAPTTPTLQITVSPDSIERTLAVNRIEFGQIAIQNSEDVSRIFNVRVDILNSIIEFEQTTLELASQSSGQFEFKITPPTEPGIYSGKIIVTSTSYRREIPVVINIKTEKSLYDLIVTIPKTMKIVEPSTDLVAQIDLLQMGIKEKMDVTLNYVIKDFSGKVHFSESETIAVENQKTLEKVLHTSDLEEGDYVLGVELIYPDGVAVASSQFKVGRDGSITEKSYIEFIIIGAIVIILFVIFFIVRKYSKFVKSVNNSKK